MAVLGQPDSKLLPRRPWVRGQLLAILKRDTVLHVDAYVRALKYAEHMNVLKVVYSEGGRKDVARDLYAIDPEGGTLMPLWKAGLGARVTWSSVNAPWMRRVHASVHALADNARYGHKWSRISLHCHYVPAPDTDPFKGVRNGYTGPSKRARETWTEEVETVQKLPDLL
jgi:hypothetical protein